MLSLVAAMAMVPVETPAERDARMGWWRDARFGMFIHWGLYAIPAGRHLGQTGHAEWIRETAQIPVKDYEKYRQHWNPTKYDAEAWVRMAKDAGMKYIVLTTKHHDGFDLFATKENDDWNVMATPYGRDIVKQLADACHRQGIRLGFYHSIMDWHHDDYLPRRSWEKDRSAAGADFDRYNRYLRNQVTELLTKYGPVSVMWFDGEWESTWSDQYGKPLYDLCRQLQPNVIVNNRVSNGRSGMEDASLRVGDYGTPEQTIPATGTPGVDWETCMTMNGNWGFNAADQNWKSTTTLLRNLIDIASKGGNYLLNVGPKADGTFPPEAVTRLKEIGDWMRPYGESIYGTTASSFDALPWGRSTTKGNRIFLQVFDWPTDGQLLVPGLGSKVRSARLLGGGTISAKSTDEGVLLSLPRRAPNAIASVIALDLEGRPVVYRSPKLTAETPEFVDSVTVQASGDGEIRYTTDGSAPTAQSPLMTSPVTLRESATVQAGTFAKGRLVAPVVSLQVRKAVPMPAVAELGSWANGLRVTRVSGDFTTAAQVLAATGGAATVATSFAPARDADGKAAEGVGLVYTGYLRVLSSGLYRFELTSDDGSTLQVAGRDVVDNDGLHAAEAKTGYVALAAGFHPIRLVWFNRTGGTALSLRMGLAGSEMRPVAGEMLRH